MDDTEKRKVAELLKEMRSTNNDGNESATTESRLNWMYKGPLDTINREEYLLGKSIDKSFEVLNFGGDIENSGTNIPKRLLQKTENTEQVDIAKKILEDPLYAIRQKELEARKQLLNNPVKLKQIKQMLLKKHQDSKSHKNHKKSSNKVKKLNLKIAKMLKKFSDDEKQKALKVILKPRSLSSSSDSLTGEKSKNNSLKKKKKKKKYSLNDSDSSTQSSISSDSASSSSSSSSSSNEEYFENCKNRKYEKKYKKRKSEKTRKRKYESTSSDSDSSKNMKDDKKDCNETRNKNKIDKNEVARKGRSDDYKSDSSNNKNTEKNKIDNYGLMMPDGSSPISKKKYSTPPRYEKPVENKVKPDFHKESKPLSEKEKKRKLKEMMEDAKIRKKEREKSMAHHRKIEAEEEKLENYDDDFMRRQISQLTSRNTMADRIKANKNNIQRSNNSMNSSFMKR
ncbi:ubiquitin-protein ligase BRE1A, putative [Pediculus humanus corporis]|uniref:Ubiquitin-protein ligase BRE1A, putative n=1 Tax=Pediculus humanus subsp. corporis TaxID=121224 RepID=E0VFN5_PEDHC|nr:ubiquitin-protein ligase BRE1A, putative [Pediculus humanus corporis]EEB12191.1 ubiquitin-protein ligase BRE1A, putative [Pediculus humanus corporis]